ncbi:MAG TPA: MBL fold metallo-hydrolase [Pyrinomonadaceae bacterium]|nr:MBL fold metallo-hydrolase [Pyrinomonadaceae bacterium]
MIIKTSKVVKTEIIGVFLLPLAIILFLTTASISQITPKNPDFEVQKITKDIYAVIRKEPPSLWFNPNTVFIIGKKDVTVVDSNISSEYTREVLAELRKLTAKPVRYVINTHWHEDHIIGNRVYREAFPNVEFIGHKSTSVDLPTIGAANRKGSLENGRGFVERLKTQIKKGENLAGQKLTEEERLGYSSDIRLIESYLAEAPNFQIILPDILVENRLELNDGKRRIEILFLGRAHTGADLVVHLPKEKILASGDLIVSPVPLVGSTSYPLEYGATLENLLKLNARVIIPGHGAVLRDASYVKLMIRLLNSLKQQTESAVGRGENLEQMRKSVNLEEFRKLFAGDSQHKSFVFQNYVFLPATAAAFRQLTEKK